MFYGVHAKTVYRYTNAKATHTHTHARTHARAYARTHAHIASKSINQS